VNGLHDGVRHSGEDRSEAINDLANSMAADLSNLERVHVMIDAFEEAAIQLVHKGGIPIDLVETVRNG